MDLFQGVQSFFGSKSVDAPDKSDLTVAALDKPLKVRVAEFWKAFEDRGITVTDDTKVWVTNSLKQETWVERTMEIPVAANNAPNSSRSTMRFKLHEKDGEMAIYQLIDEPVVKFFEENGSVYMHPRSTQYSEVHLASIRNLTFQDLTTKIVD